MSIARMVVVMQKMNETWCIQEPKDTHAGTAPHLEKTKEWKKENEAWNAMSGVLVTVVPNSYQYDCHY